jgi:hypothetical protein
MHYEIFRNLSAVFLWVFSKTVHTMEKNPFDLERFLVCDENLPKKRKNDENL